MKCKKCKHIFNTNDYVCPFCQTKNMPSKFRLKAVNALNKRIPNDKFNLSYLNIIFILFVNLSLISIITNLLFNSLLENEFLWSPFLVVFLFMIYSIFKHISKVQYNMQLTVNKIMYSVIVLFSVEYLTSVQTFLSLPIIVSSLIVLLNTIALLFLLFGSSSNLSFFVTIIINLIIMLVIFIFSFIEKNYLFTILDKSFTYIAFGLSVIILINYIVIHFISIMKNIRERF